jgi:hypothetical protein
MIRFEAELFGPSSFSCGYPGVIFRHVYEAKLPVDI